MKARMKVKLCFPYNITGESPWHKVYRTFGDLREYVIVVVYRKQNKNLKTTFNFYNMYILHYICILHPIVHTLSALDKKGSFVFKISPLGTK